MSEEKEKDLSLFSLGYFMGCCDVYDRKKIDKKVLAKGYKVFQEVTKNI